MNSWKNATTPKSYAEAPPIVATSSGQYLFTTRCATCHTIGRGDKIGPDLAGITGVRDRGWLTRYIAAPDTMRHEGDPIARALFAKYKTVRMPNLSLTDAEAADVVAYVDAQTAAADDAAGSTPGAMKAEPRFK